MFATAANGVASKSLGLLRTTVGAVLRGRPRFPHCVSPLGRPRRAAPTVVCNNVRDFSGKAAKADHYVLAEKRMTKKESPFACDMNAIPLEKRGAHIATIEKLFRLVQSKRELPDGYAFELPNESEVLLTAAEFISQERLCCPFFGFALEIEREGGPLWLSLTGRDGVKPFIMAEIGEHLLASIQTRE